LAIVGAVELAGDRSFIGLPRIAVDLRIAQDARAQIGDELLGIGLVPLADAVADDRLVEAAQPDEQ
jgi:hypothetical protein